jgi:hypothetical protein
LYQLDGPPAKRTRQRLDGSERGRLEPALQLADICPVEIRAMSQLFLGYAGLSPKRP